MSFPRDLKRENDLRHSDLIHALDDLLEFLETSRERQLGTSHKVMLINRRINSIKEATNRLIAELHTDPERLVTTLSIAITTLNNILTKIPNEKDYQTVWLELTASHNLLLGVFATYYQQGTDMTRLQAQANLLSRLLVGIPKIEKIPTLPPKEDPNYRKSLTALLNAVMSAESVYTAALTAIPTMHYEDFINWANNAFRYASLVLKVSDLLVYEEIYKNDPLNRNIFFERVTVTLLPIIRAYSIPLLTYSKLGELWPQEIDSHGFIEPPIHLGLIRLAEKLEEKMDARLDELQRLYDEGILDRNDDPSRRDEIQNVVLIGRHVFKTWKVTIEALYSSLITQDPQSLELIERAIQYQQDAFDDVMQIAQKASPSTSSIATQLALEIVEQLIPLFVLKSIQMNNSSVFHASLSPFLPLLEQVPVQQNPNLHFLRILAEIYVDAHAGDPLNHSRLIYHLQELAKKTSPFWPRHRVAIKILLWTLTLIFDQPDLDSLEQQMAKTLQSEIIMGGQKHLEQAFVNYYNSLLQAAKGIEPVYDFVSGSIEINILDPYTWLIPDFSKYTKEKQLGNILYIPFNTNRMGIIHSKASHSNLIE